MPLATVPDRSPAAFLHRPRLRDRLLARWAPGGLDRRLAWGDAPDSDPATMLRAQALIGRPVRLVLAGRLRELGDEASGGVRRRQACIPADRHAALGARRELGALADRLADGGPVAARGVALAQLLLTEPASPLYRRGGDDDLRALARQALAALEPAAA